MPFKSAAQKRLMEGVAHGWTPKHMKRPPSKQVAKEFVTADRKGRRKAGRGIGDAIGRVMDRRRG